jgi:hypothetical protein
MRTMLTALLIVILIGCAQQTQEHAGAELFEAGTSKGVLEGKRMQEASGLVASISNPEMFWTHNDSGNDAEIFLIDKTGKLVCTVHLPGIKNRDWEDITIGAGPEKNKQYLYVGDIGDNKSAFNHKIIYRIEEPILGSAVTDTTLLKIDEIKFKLPDGARDSESLMLDPQTNDLFIFSKREANVNLYKLSQPFSTTDTMTAERVLEKLPLTMIVAADISPGGSEIVAKNYDHIYYWKRQSGEKLEDAIAKPAEELLYTAEPQGESIAFDRASTGFYTLSEQKKKMPQHLFFYRRK